MVEHVCTPRTTTPQTPPFTPASFRPDTSRVRYLTRIIRLLSQGFTAGSESATQQRRFRFDTGCPRRRVSSDSSPQHARPPYLTGRFIVDRRPRLATLRLRRLGRLLQRVDLLAVLVVAHARRRGAVATALARTDTVTHAHCQLSALSARSTTHAIHARPEASSPEALPTRRRARTAQSCRESRTTRSTAASGTSWARCTRGTRRRRRYPLLTRRSQRDCGPGIRGAGQCTDRGGLDHVADRESLDGLVLGRTPRAVAAADRLDVAAALLVASAAEEPGQSGQVTMAGQPVAGALLGRPLLDHVG